MRKSDAEYYFWRIMNVCIKPSALLLSASYIDEMSGNVLAISMTISALFMASLSFGSYRLIFRSSHNKKIAYHAHRIRKSIFFVNSLILGLLTIVFYTFTNNENLIFIYLFVLTEHVIHDECRLLLYQGSRRKWARNTSIRSFFILILPCIVLISNGDFSLTTSMSILFVINFLYSYLNRGLFHLSIPTIRICQRKSFYKYYFNHFNYFLSATMNRFNQQSDRFLFSLLSFESLWAYSVTAQIANIPLMLFEMTEMSKLKEKVSRTKTHFFAMLGSSAVRTMLITSLLSLLIYATLSIFIEKFSANILFILFFLAIIANFISALSLYNGEKLFWHLSAPRKYLRLEMRAFSSSLIAFFFGFLIGNVVLVLAPKICSASVRVFNARQQLIKNVDTAC